MAARNASASTTVSTFNLLHCFLLVLYCCSVVLLFVLTAFGRDTGSYSVVSVKILTFMEQQIFFFFLKCLHKVCLTTGHKGMWSILRLNVYSRALKSKHCLLQNLKDVLSDLIPKEQTRIKNFKQQYGKTNIGQITVDMVSGGDLCTYV